MLKDTLKIKITKPETALTDVSRAFDRVHHGLFKRKLFNFGLPRQVIELVVEFISFSKLGER